MHERRRLTAAWFRGSWKTIRRTSNSLFRRLSIARVCITLALQIAHILAKGPDLFLGKHGKDRRGGPEMDCF